MISGRPQDADLRRIIDVNLRAVALPEGGLAISAWLLLAGSAMCLQLLVARIGERQQMRAAMVYALDNPIEAGEEADPTVGLEDTKLLRKTAARIASASMSSKGRISPASLSKASVPPAVSRCGISAGRR